MADKIGLRITGRLGFARWTVVLVKPADISILVTTGLRRHNHSAADGP
jgi:hypothetical protein